MLACTDLCAQYRGGPRVLGPLSLACTPARVTAIIGPNGAGKSTLLRALLGTLEPTAGAVTLDSQPLATFTPAQRAARIAYVAQRPTLAAPMDVRRVVELGRHARGPSPAIIDAALEALGLTRDAHRPLGELSTGQQQRVSLARALAQLTTAPASATDDLAGTTLLADEPISAMDPAHALRALALLHNMARRGCAVLIVMHELTLALAHADDAALLSCDGTLAASGAVSDVLTPQRLGPVYGLRFVREGRALTPTLEPEASAVRP